MNDNVPALEAVRQACIEAALAAYEDAGIAGLCAEGRWEAAISAMQSLDIKRVAATDRRVEPRSGIDASGLQSGPGASNAA